jgi:hypothetical protein
VAANFKVREETMYRTILCAAAGAIIFAMPAKADETLKFCVVQYVSSQQFQPIGDVPNHIQGLIRYPGIASFPDGSTAKTLTLNAGEGIAGPGGGGTVNGYENMIFGDGSELWWKYTGIYKIDSKGVLLLSGTLAVTSGKGRYAGAKGDGTYEGTQTAGGHEEREALAVVDVVVNIKK